MRNGWTLRTMHLGQYRLVSELIAEGTVTIEAHGNSREGWMPYLIRKMPDGFEACLEIGPWFNPREGDRLCDLRAAAARIYGIDPKQVKHGQNWFA